MDNFSFLNAAHAGYFSDLYDQYLKDPDSLEPSWKAFFQGYDFANSDFLKEEILDGISPQIPDHVQKEFKVINLINGYRSRGHLFTKTNPRNALFYKIFSQSTHANSSYPNKKNFIYVLYIHRFIRFFISLTISIVAFV